MNSSRKTIRSIPDSPQIRGLLILGEPLCTFRHEFAADGSLFAKHLCRQDIPAWLFSTPVTLAGSVISPANTMQKGRGMKSLVAVVLFLTPCVVLSFAAQGRQPSGNSDRGRYLAEDVAMCVQCHTPRDENGTLLRSQLFAGAAVPVSAPWRTRVWAEFAPRIAGLTQYSDEQAVKLLTEGIARTGKQLRAPMPPFRMSAQDARDIIAFLRTLD
jgi:mono/diheme cytochrome c family protein